VHKYALEGNSNILLILDQKGGNFIFGIIPNIRFICELHILTAEKV
jgi:hypothetical protein